MPDSLSPRTGTIILGILLLLEYGFFRTYVLRDIAGLYPFGWDQPAYLIDSYVRYDNILHDGFWKGLKESQLFASAASFLFSTQAALFYLIFGASRYTALSINFIYWAMLQIIAYKTALNVTQKVSFALAFVGLLLALKMPFMRVGGLFDFRIDFVATCLYGMFVCAVVSSGVFLDKRWSSIATILGVVLILTRYFTLVYLGIIFACLCGYYAVTYLKHHHDDAKTRLKHILISGGVALALVAPFLWLAKEAIYGYYFMGHLLGPEKAIRAEEAGLSTWIQNVLFYPVVFLKQHISISLLILGLLAFILCLIQYKKILRALPKDVFFFLGLSIVVPTTVLSFDTVKSAIVIGIISIPVLWIIFLLFISAMQTVSVKKNILKTLQVTVPIFILLFGAVFFYSSFLKMNFFRKKDNIDNVTVMYSDIIQYFHSINQPNIVFSADNIADYYGKDILRVIAYEKYSYLPAAVGTSLGGSIFAVEKETMQRAMEQTDVFIYQLNDDSNPLVYPASKSLKLLRAEMMEVADKNFIILNDYSFDGHDMRVYVRPNFSVRTFGNETTAERGLILNIPAIVMDNAKTIQLKIKKPLQGDLSHTLHVSILDSYHQKMHLNYSIDSLDNEIYQVSVDLSNLTAPEKMLTLKLVDGDEKTASTPMLVEKKVIF